MSSRIPLQIISGNTPNYSSMICEPYCNCCYYENHPMYMENCYQTSDISYNFDPISTQSVSIDSKKKLTRRSKHVPHHLRPQHIVERRNKRERLRVQDVNQAFYMLEQLLPLDSNSVTQNSSRISKVRTLRKAVDYIDALQQMLNENNY
jgi:hypothetical protein